jgi:hypothetical protein
MEAAIITKREFARFWNGRGDWAKAAVVDNTITTTANITLRILNHLLSVSSLITNASDTSRR